ncbi:DUF1566 domain-containing protein [Thiomicrospira sp. ALE5]|uniref:Lcl C-terminal domain-containing protein n=1 Tax=Thiomicrospira sp. ALE5 TaxID=748650 RepID=UPI0008E94BA6|nr:DUF1566 domain-containing protein [Thiomicrospira sp. ALE5]SFR54013.1 Protein of unknown function [Thiomicrospira sp. ALE5]
MKKQRFLKTTIFSMMLATGSLILTGCSADSSSASSAESIGLSYIDNGDGTVTDTETNLTWMRCSLGQQWTGSTCTGVAIQMNHNDAAMRGLGFNYAGKSDWRLPTFDELHSLVYCSSGQQREVRLDSRGIAIKKGNTYLNGQCEGNYSRPAIFTSAFPNTPEQKYWSASMIPGVSSDWAWGVHFFSGVESHLYRSSSRNNHVRLVRGGQ